MTDFTAFVLAVLTLLSVPGPTNTLLATSGATVGVQRSLRLVLAEIAGYLTMITLLTQLARPIVEQYPGIPLVARIVAAAYLLWLALELWRNPPMKADGRTGAITVTRLYLTTLVNPKALIFAFVIFPPSDLPDYLRHAVVFTALVVTCGTLWVIIGGIIGRSSRGFASAAGIARVASVALCFFAATIAASVAAPLAGWTHAAAPAEPSVSQTVK